MTKKIVCEVSGGYDSAAALVMILDMVKLAGTYTEVFGVFIDYDQNYAKQEACGVRYLGNRFAKREGFKGIETLKVQMKLPLPDSQRPEAYIPIRNLVIASAMANYAQSVDAEDIVIGHKTREFRPDDPYCFRDCTKEFYDKLEEVIELGSEDGRKIKFITPLVSHDPPYVSMTKAQVLKVLVDEMVYLPFLWNCYEMGEKPCQICFHCVEMKKALIEIGKYEDFNDWW